MLKSALSFFIGNNHTIPMFAYLHVYSYYSFLRGLPSPKELAQTADQCSMPALALTVLTGISGSADDTRQHRQAREFIQRLNEIFPDCLYIKVRKCSRNKRQVIQ